MRGETNRGRRLEREEREEGREEAGGRWRRKERRGEGSQTKAEDEKEKGREEQEDEKEEEVVRGNYQGEGEQGIGKTVWKIRRGDRGEEKMRGEATVIGKGGASIT